MSLVSFIPKLADIVLKPIELMTDWAREPLNRFEHARLMERDEAKIKAESNYKMQENEHNINLQIKKETEVVRIIAEIEEFKKDQEFARMKAVSDAIMKYQVELTKLNIDAIQSLGSMQLELRERAHELVYSKTIKYKELQNQACLEAAEDLMKIEKDFSDNPIARDILVKAVDKRLSNIIETASNFLLELNADIRLLNQNISLLTEQGQRFIEGHLEKFHLIDSVQINRIE